MKTIALFGSFNEKQQAALKAACPVGYNIITAKKTELDKVKEADYVCCRAVPFTEETFEALPNLKFISKWGIGYDKIDVKSAGAHHIPVSVCVGGNSEPVAELTVALMLDVLRGVSKADEALKKFGAWDRDIIGGRAYLLQCKQVGLVGFGNIAKKVAKILINGFGCKVSYYDVFRLKPEQEQQYPVQYKKLPDIMRDSDVVSVHVPLMDSTRNMLDAKLLGMMKKTAILINTARGGVVQEDVLVKVLEEGKILGAGLDSFAVEPLAADSSLLKLDNVVVTPHIGGTTVDNDINMGKICMGNVIEFDQHHDLTMRNIVNRQFVQ